jgi:hypothetical protein
MKNAIKGFALEPIFFKKTPQQMIMA